MAKWLMNVLRNTAWYYPYIRPRGSVRTWLAVRHDRHEAASSRSIEARPQRRQVPGALVRMLATNWTSEDESIHRPRDSSDSRSRSRSPVHRQHGFAFGEWPDSWYSILQIYICNCWKRGPTYFFKVPCLGMVVFANNRKTTSMRSLKSSLINVSRSKVLIRKGQMQWQRIAQIEAMTLGIDVMALNVFKQCC